MKYDTHNIKEQLICKQRSMVIFVCHTGNCRKVCQQSDFHTLACCIDAWAQSSKCSLSSAMVKIETKSQLSFND